MRWSGSLDLITGSTPSGVIYFSQVSFQGVNNWADFIRLVKH